MPISEDQLARWSKQGPSAQFTSTYETLRGVLKDPAAPYAGREFSIFLQGSYKNDTNIYGDSDVDVVVRLDQTLYPDLHFLNEDDTARYNAQRSAAGYTLAKFKEEVVAWLAHKFGAASVVPGKKAVLVKGNGSRRDADVLVCATLRRYYSYPAGGSPRFVDGIVFFTPDGTRIENFPERHSDNCTVKHQGTNGRFKPTVRIFKNLRNKLTDLDLIEFGQAPSYFLEGLLYNVPADRFGGSEQLNFEDVLDWLQAADRSEFVCANEQFYLLRPGPVTWAPENCAKFLSAARIYWDA